MPFVINAEMGSEDGVVKELRKIQRHKIRTFDTACGEVTCEAQLCIDTLRDPVQFI
jgi:hypothetical protein